MLVGNPKSTFASAATLDVPISGTLVLTADSFAANNWFAPFAGTLAALAGTTAQTVATNNLTLTLMKNLTTTGITLTWTAGAVAGTAGTLAGGTSVAVAAGDQLSWQADKGASNTTFDLSLYAELTPT